MQSVWPTLSILRFQPDGYISSKESHQHISSSKTPIGPNKTYCDTLDRLIYPTLEPDLKLLGLNFSSSLYLCISSFCNKSFALCVSSCKLLITSAFIYLSMSLGIMTFKTKGFLATTSVSFDTSVICPIFSLTLPRLTNESARLFVT